MTRQLPTTSIALSPLFWFQLRHVTYAPAMATEGVKINKLSPDSDKDALGFRV